MQCQGELGCLYNVSFSRGNGGKGGNYQKGKGGKGNGKGGRNKGGGMGR